MWKLPGAVCRLVCCRPCRPKLMHVNSCALCGTDPTTRGVCKDCALRLVAMVPSRPGDLS